ncbi:hypothetical protein TNIN_153301 [Trichonephila inaurata madagascariensis]|uniref:Uncharacterized protein n=1 Tax=Trichonephila inaurata madagascariensis TaxID=2747483 RepID=A0A8X6XU16_9ARAC|nr:hypothetical protein TNIN_153301 [Trichonephila inaurata madagascariensis]
MELDRREEWIDGKIGPRDGGTSWTGAFAEWGPRRKWALGENEWTPMKTTSGPRGCGTSWTGGNRGGFDGPLDRRELEPETVGLYRDESELKLDRVGIGSTGRLELGRIGPGPGGDWTGLGFGPDGGYINTRRRLGPGVLA